MRGRRVRPTGAIQLTGLYQIMLKVTPRPAIFDRVGDKYVKLGAESAGANRLSNAPDKLRREHWSKLPRTSLTHPRSFMRTLAATPRLASSLCHG